MLVFGNNYDTCDGIGIGKRDFIHVEDLAIGHIAVLNNIQKANKINISLNLGKGQSFSVLEIIDIFDNCTRIKFLSCLRRVVSLSYN